MVEMNQEQLNKFWSDRGLNPELFPIYYPLGPQPFRDGNGVPSGARGAEATLNADLSNFAHMFLGVRLSNVYDTPSDPTADDVNLLTYLKDHVDGEQTMTIQLAQQSVIVSGVLQKHVTGGYDGYYWHPFPVPFPMAGANNIQIRLIRQTPYPLVNEQFVTPRVYGVVYAAVARADIQTIAPQRIERY